MRGRSRFELDPNPNPNPNPNPHLHSRPRPRPHPHPHPHQVELVLSSKLAVGLVKQEDFSARAMWTIGEEISLKLTTVGLVRVRVS